MCYLDPWQSTDERLHCNWTFVFNCTWENKAGDRRSSEIKYASFNLSYRHQIQEVLADVQTFAFIFLCGFFGNPLAQNLRKPRLLGTIHGWNYDLLADHLATSVLIVRVWTYSMFSSVVDVEGCCNCSASFLNFPIHLYTLHFSKVLFSYCAKSVRWIFAPGTPSAHKKWITT